MKPYATIDYDIVNDEVLYIKLICHIKNRKINFNSSNLENDWKDMISYLLINGYTNFNESSSITHFLMDTDEYFEKDRMILRRK